MRTLCFAVLALWMPTAAFAQRELHWDNFEVAAHLDADGHLRVAETQTLVFTGDWNGGERTFNIHPRQKLSFTGIYRSRGAAWQELTEDPGLDDIDDYAWADATTLRWRSRRTTDPPFANTGIRYELRYVLSEILLKEGDGYLLNHDFAFSDRDGTIDRFALRLTLDPSWQPMSDLREVYMASGIPPGTSFVLKLPLRYTGARVPATLDLTRSREIVLAVSVLLGATVLALMWFFVREESIGRFAPLAEHVDEPWLGEHILKYPAEVIGAAWDERIGTAEVVALIARMVSEGTLESVVNGRGGTASMTLRLKVDRSTLEGYERALVEGLFFDGRTETSTRLVKAHYRKEGFNPATAITPELEKSVGLLLPASGAPRKFRLESLVLAVLGYGLLVFAWYRGNLNPIVAVILCMGTLVVAGIAAIPGAAFRRHMLWGRSAALLCLIPALAIAAAAALFLWFYVGAGVVDLSTETLLGIVAVALGMTNSSINALRSRQNRAGIALRKKLAAGRAFFISELRKDRPALRDEWYPWLLAFELSKQADAWSTARSTADADAHRHFGGSSTSAPSSERWTGFGGGRSGGAGAGASWAAAASGMAAGVSPPSSSGSGGSSSSSGGSSSSSSSGGGGGGGW